MKERSELDVAAGKLILAIQKEWGKELGEPCAELSEDVMDLAHNLLQAHTIEKIKVVLDGNTITEYLGEQWVRSHPNVLPVIMRLDKLID